MGNNFVHFVNQDDDDDDGESELSLDLSVEDLTGNQVPQQFLMGLVVGSLQRPTTEMPVIRKKPDLSTFRVSWKLRTLIGWLVERGPQKIKTLTKK